MNQDVLFQLTCLSLTPSVHIMFPQHVAMVFVSVAYTPNAHEHIAQSVIIRRLLEACKMRELEQKDDQIEILMLWSVHDLYNCMIRVGYVLMHFPPPPPLHTHTHTHTLIATSHSYS